MLNRKVVSLTVKMSPKFEVLSSRYSRDVDAFYFGPEKPRVPFDFGVDVPTLRKQKGEVGAEFDFGVDVPTMREQKCEVGDEFDFGNHLPR